jgi:cytochrome c
MKNIPKFLGLAVLISLPSIHAFAGDNASVDEAVKFVSKAVTFLKANGEEKAFAAFSKSKSESGEFIDRDLYIFVYDTKGFMHAIGNGNAKKMVGKSLIEFRDADGVYLVKGLLGATEKTGKGWFDYKFPNPVSNKVEAKSGYCERVADKIICSGIYKQ